MAEAPRRGVVYACSDVRWLRETVFSAFSFKQVMPELERELYIPAPLLDANPIPPEYFTRIIRLEDMRIAHRPRFESFLMTELDEALFLDGDTMLLSPIPEVFELLELFDLGLTIAPQLHSPYAAEKNAYEHMPKVSFALPEYNGGFIAAKVNEGFRNFVRLWLESFEKCIEVGLRLDQPSLRVAVAHSGLRVAVLPNNYNFRANVVQSLKGHVKILHAHADLPKIASFINQQLHFRVYQPSPEYVYGFKPKEFQKAP